MAMGADAGFGATITFSSGIFTGLLRDVTINGLGERSPLDTSHMTTTNGWRTFLPGDLKNPGTVSAEALFTSGNLSGFKTAVNSSQESITITFPSQGTAGTFVCSGFAVGATIPVPYQDLMLSTIEIQFTGEPTMTNGTT